MKKIRFASILWLLLIPVIACIKIAWEFLAFSEETAIHKPLPINWLDASYPYNIFIGIVVIIIATYISFAFINAYINRQTTYTIALFFSSLALFSFTPKATTSLVAILLFMNGILLLFSFDEKKKNDFVPYNIGFFIGLALFFEIQLFVLALILFVFLFTFRFSAQQILQYWAGILTPLLFIFPLLYFFNALPDWQRYFIELYSTFSFSLKLDILDCLLLSILLIFCTIQAIIIYKKMKKPLERLILTFTFVYLIISLCIGLFFYTLPNIYVLFIIPAMSILYSLSKTENQQIPVLITFMTLFYFLLKTKSFVSIF